MNFKPTFEGGSFSTSAGMNSKGGAFKTSAVLEKLPQVATVTPTDVVQKISASVGYYLSQVVVEPIPNRPLPQYVTVTPLDNDQIIEADSGYYIQSVTVERIPSSYGHIAYSGGVITVY